MKRFAPAVTTAAAILSAALLLAPGLGFGQSEAEKAKAKAAKAKQNAKTFANNATVLTFWDREGKTVGMAGDRALYQDTVFSPDRTRVAVIKRDLDAESADLFVVDIATGKDTRITTSARREFVQTAVWSPDGAHLAYPTIRDGAEGLYRRAANGEGPEELLYKNPGAFLDLSDWSADGRFLAFSKSDLSGGILYVLPLSGQGERQPIEVFRSEQRIFGARFFPDGRFVAYLIAPIDQPTRNQVWVRPFDPSGAAPAAGPWQIADGSRGRIYWRPDGKEMYFLGVDLSVMVVKVSTTPNLEFAKPTVLLRPPGAVPDFIRDISRDGERFLVLPPPRGPQLQQITVFDRNGQVVAKVGEPGLYGQPAFSPDGKRLAAMRADLSNGQADIWTFDIATGSGSRVTNDALPKNLPMWSPDGAHILYSSFRGSYMGIFRRAADGSGGEELLFRYTEGAGVNLTDISPDVSGW
jgi:Tol biopolymer transport system component